MTKDEALNLVRNLDGVIADVEQGDGFDDVCLDTVKYVRDVLAEQPAPAPEVREQQEPVAWMHKETGLLRQANKAKGGDFEPNHWTPLYTAIEQALAAPVQEPVATLIDHYGFTDGVVRFDGVENMEQLPIGTKFYIAPLAAPVQEKNT